MRTLRNEAEEGLASKGISLELFPSYCAQLEKELRLITKFKLGKQFELAITLQRWADKKGINTGYGRGIFCSSLVAYCTGISEIDPIKHGLESELFLNRLRVKKPLPLHFDVAQNREAETLEFIKDNLKYCKVEKGSFKHCHNVRVDESIHSIQVIGLESLERIVPDLDVNDKKIYAFLRSMQNPKGIFYLEAPKLWDYVNRMQVRNFNELIGMCARVWPKPILAGLTEDFVERKDNLILYNEDIIKVIMQQTGMKYWHSVAALLYVQHKRVHEEHKEAFNELKEEFKDKEVFKYVAHCAPYTKQKAFHVGMSYLTCANIAHKMAVHSERYEATDNMDMARMFFLEH